MPDEQLFIVIASTKLHFRPGSTEYVRGGYPVKLCSDPVSYAAAKVLRDDMERAVRSDKWEFRIEAEEAQAA